MTHTQAVQAQSGQPMSGVALKVEQNLLNARLADISDTFFEFDANGDIMPKAAT